jgi:sulfur relay (sulfurtransferase) complex TusBCD TusD component (DsrE family)
VPSKNLSYTFILTQSPVQYESNQTAQSLVAELIAAGDTIDRIFFYQDAVYIGLQSQVPGQGLEPSYEGWLFLFSFALPIAYDAGFLMTQKQSVTDKMRI